MRKKTTTTMTARNKAFWAKSKPEQRVAVAKDVLKQLNSGFFLAKSGKYGVIKNLRRVVKTESFKLDEIMKMVMDNEGRCDVCGIGGCFYSMVGLGNNISSADVGLDNETLRTGSMPVSNYDMEEHLKKVFPMSQLSLIENAFETSIGFNEDHASIKSREKALKFGEAHKNDAERLRAIMNNIIKNKGTFKP